MISKDISLSPAALKLYWHELTPEQKAALVEADRVRAWMRYNVSLTGLGSNHFGCISFSLVYLHKSRIASGLSEPEVLLRQTDCLEETETITLTLPASLIVQILQFGVSAAPDIAAQIASMNGGSLPEIAIFSPDSN